TYMHSKAKYWFASHRLDRSNHAQCGELEQSNWSFAVSETSTEESGSSQAMAGKIPFEKLLNDFIRQGRAEMCLGVCNHMTKSDVFSVGRFGILLQEFCVSFFKEVFQPRRSDQGV